MSNVLAAIGVAQMEVFEERVNACREVFEWYKQEFEEEVRNGKISFMPELEKSRGNRWLTTLTFANSDINSIIQYLQNHKIESRHLWKPMHMQPLFQGAKAVVDGTSEQLFQSGLCLPSGSDLSRDEVKRVATLVKEVL
jgi:UDP-N-acetylbacillosamine transaminase